MKSTHGVLIRPIMTEKSLRDTQERNVYTFEVDTAANKLEIKKAVEHIFQVSVVKVTSVRYKGKLRRVRVVQGRRRNWKKAMVTLKKGDAIELT